MATAQEKGDLLAVAAAAPPPRPHPADTGGDDWADRPRIRSVQPTARRTRQGRATNTRTRLLTTMEPFTGEGGVTALLGSDSSVSLLRGCINTRLTDWSHSRRVQIRGTDSASKTRAEVQRVNSHLGLWCLEFEIHQRCFFG
ncbi:hypothetical protein PAPYR_10034 [Paratrimastix pyriformis]|uniref:Uncharacterized protein n=1 Tax=Paratrimastix pyriformis TaxID=342808 RepID=A0ABQ8UCN9_9EUKA|nr:hypothetical protein PAPYR_10034 [Paratrimastix pyriformis]